jgi:hypothetical protein
MLQAIHIAQIVLAFLIAGATGMQTTYPQYTAIWSPIQLLATAVLTVLGLISQSIVPVVSQLIHKKLDKLLAAMDTPRPQGPQGPQGPAGPPGPQA